MGLDKDIKELRPSVNIINAVDSKKLANKSNGH